jgi:hypothetical protein
LWGLVTFAAVRFAIVSALAHSRPDRAPLP